MSLSQIATTVRSISRETTLSEAARVMIRDSIGSLLICKEAGAVIEGILTDRDIVREIAEGRDPSQSTVADFTSRPVVTQPMGATRREIAGTMKTHGVRRIPLVDEKGKVVAIVSLDDVLIESSAELFDLARAIRAEFQHEAPDPDPMD